MPSSDSKHIHKAYLTSLTEGVIELFRDWKAPRMPPITLEGARYGELSLYPLPSSDYALESGYYIDSKGAVVFVFNPSDHGDFDRKNSSVYVAGSFNDWQNAVGDPAWELVPETWAGKEVLTLRKDVDIFSCSDGCQFKFVTNKHHWIGLNMSAPNLSGDGMGNWNYIFQPKLSGRHRLGFLLKKPLELSENHSLLYHTRKGAEQHHLSPGDFFMGLSSDKELGAIPRNGKTTFRLFAPRARWVKVGHFKDLKESEKAKWLLMSKGDDFVWEVTIDEDLSGGYYWYRLDGPNNEFSMFDPKFNVLDPYAKATVCCDGPGIVISDTRMQKANRGSYKLPQWQDLIIQEGHVRDFVAKRKRGEGDETPLGFSDLSRFAKEPDFYPKWLGVNAIELQPIQENDSQSYGEYHWGYMTANFFAPHSGYGKNPEKASQIEEFKELVATLHSQGFAVILDVVYNHVGEPAHLMFIDKLYYFQLDAQGSPSNWSGCGNDFRSEAPMAKRLIIDSLKCMVEQYGVDGFRFDLADLVGKPVLCEIERELKKVRSDLILIAEPWSFRGHIGRDLRDTGYASWNDGYREFLKKYVRGEPGMETVKYFLKGSPIHYASWPAQTVNYVEAHDDRVWIDDITENSENNGTHPTGNDVARTRIMVSMLMMSVGIPMLHAGMDFLVTKNGVTNTYQDGPRNALDYRRMKEFSACSRYFKDWVAFRLSDRGSLIRHYSRAPDRFFEFIEAGNGSTFACIYNAAGEWGSRRLLFAVNPTFEDVDITLGDWGNRLWRQIADHERFWNESEQDWSNRPGPTLYLPRLSCGLWEMKGV